MDIRITQRVCFQCRFSEFILRDSFIMSRMPQKAPFSKHASGFHITSRRSHLENYCIRPITGRLATIGKDISAFYLNTLIKWFSFFSPNSAPIPSKLKNQFSKFFCKWMFECIYFLEGKREVWKYRALAITFKSDFGNLCQDHNSRYGISW